MMRNKAWKVSCGIATLITLSGLAPAQDAAPEKINLQDFPATSVDNVIVPVPSEIFNVLDKLGSPNWKAEFRKNYAIKPGDRPHTALLLGAVIGDGFIAVQSKDNEDVRDIGRLVLDLSAALGVKNAVISHYKSIQQAADAGKWDVVRQELDKTQASVRDAMVQLGDDQLAQLVSLGGWLRGTEVLTSIVGKDYTSDGADLLHQPELITFFQHRISKMNAKLKKHPLVIKVDSELKIIAPLIKEGDGKAISADSVAKIHKITAGVLKMITSKDS